MKKKLHRNCQPCTACCDGWVRINVHGLDAYPGHPCIHSTGKGCDDYNNRPQNPCINFQCGWVINKSPLPEWFKPSEARVIVIFNKIQWQGFPVDLAIPVGKKIPPRSLNWLKNFAKKNGRPFIYTEQQSQIEFQKQQKVFGYGPPDFQQQVAQWEKSGTVLW